MILPGFRGNLLQTWRGKPMIQRVYEQAVQGFQYGRCGYR